MAILEICTQSLFKYVMMCLGTKYKSDYRLDQTSVVFWYNVVWSYMVINDTPVIIFSNGHLIYPQLFSQVSLQFSGLGWCRSSHRNEASPNSPSSSSSSLASPLPLSRGTIFWLPKTRTLGPANRYSKFTQRCLINFNTMKVGYSSSYK